MKNRVFIIHGLDGKPQGNWFPWLKTELEKLGVEVIIPAMPNPSKPVLSEWLKKLNDVIGTPDKQTYFVGHSLGAIAIFRYLATLPQGVKPGGVISVAGFSETLGNKTVTSFFEKPLDYHLVKRNVTSIVIIQSDNDPYVPVTYGEMMKNTLGGKLLTIKSGGHLNTTSGHLQLPVVLDQLKEIMKLP